jgi:hypothetical protein
MSIRWWLDLRAFSTSLSIQNLNAGMETNNFAMFSRVHMTTTEFSRASMMVGIDMPASSAKTQEWLGWRPSHPGLIADLDLAKF